MLFFLNYYLLLKNFRLFPQSPEKKLVCWKCEWPRTVRLFEGWMYGSSQDLGWRYKLIRQIKGDILWKRLTPSFWDQNIRYVYILMTCAPQKYDKGLYMIGYETGKIILKFPPFFNLERGTLNLWNSCCKVYKQYFEFSCYWYSSFYGREFQNNFACSVPYDI